MIGARTQTPFHGMSRWNCLTRSVSSGFDGRARRILSPVRGIVWTMKSNDIECDSRPTGSRTNARTPRHPRSVRAPRRFRHEVRSNCRATLAVALMVRLDASERRLRRGTSVCCRKVLNGGCHSAESHNLETGKRGDHMSTGGSGESIHHHRARGGEAILTVLRRRDESPST